MDENTIGLVKAAKRGKISAFETLFLQEKEYLYRTAFLYMKNESDALDLVQECILQCMLSIGKLRNPEYFRTWMTRILINCARQEWKKKGRFVQAEAEEEQAVSEKVISREEQMDLYHAIDNLAYPYNVIIIQKYFAGMKLDEIAQMLEMPIGTVKVYHARAKSRLREFLEED
ncbi:MAG: sigma-70 family RNA polymerase sigma factor [Lachnospiraceae bacterium]|nr:sigma-70 family RNA polymerase sigma factor [Lachnospiraceae bacterium]